MGRVRRLIGGAFFYDRTPSLVIGRLGQESGTFLKLIQLKALFPSRCGLVSLRTRVRVSQVRGSSEVREMLVGEAKVK